MDEQKITGANYIMTFANNIYLLIQQTASYKVLIVSFERKYKDLDSIEDFQPEEFSALQQTIQNLKYSIYMVYVQYQSLIRSVPNLRDENSDNIKELYLKMDKTYIINRELLDNFIIELNIVLLKNVIKSLLESSQDIINNIYEPTNKPTAN